MRQFTNGESFLDNDGNILIGRIRFCKKDTTTLQTIYNIQGSEISNPIDTNNLGQTNVQVFLGDSDYTVYFDKLLDDGSYEQQYSIVNLYDTFNVKVDSHGLQVVNTIADLRQTDPITVAEQAGNKIILLAGYNTYGDKPSIQYVWDETSVKADNGGNIIKVSGIETGRWVFIEGQTNKFDVRHWGAFPASTYDSITSEQGYRIQAASIYAADRGGYVYFPNTGVECFYGIITSVTNSIWDSNSYAVIPSTVTTNISISLANIDDNLKNFKVYQATDYMGTVTLKGDELYYDCIYGPVEAHSLITLNTNYIHLNGNVSNTTTFTGKTIEVESSFTTSTNVILDNCVLVENSVLDDSHITGTQNMTLSNMRLTEKMFSSSVTFTKITIDSTCSILANDFNNIMTYIKMKTLANQPDYSDCGGRSLDNSVQLLDGCRLINASGNINNQGNITLYNCQVVLENELTSLTCYQCMNVSIKSAPQSSLYSIDSNIIENGTSTSTADYCNALILQNSTYRPYASYNKSILNYFYIVDSRIEGSNIKFNIDASYSGTTITHCQLPGIELCCKNGINIDHSEVLSITYDSSNYGTTPSYIIDHCVISGDVDMIISNQMNFSFTDNTISGQLKFVNPNNYTDVTIADGKIERNTETVSQPLALPGLSSWYNTDDSTHTYTYKDNKELLNDWQTVAMHYQECNTVDAPPETLVYNSGFTFSNYSAADTTTASNYINIDVNNTAYLKLFCFGITNIPKQRLRMTIDDSMYYVECTGASTSTTPYDYVNDANSNFFAPTQNGKYVYEWITTPTTRTIAFYDTTGTKQTKSDIQDLMSVTNSGSSYRQFRFIPYIGKDLGSGVYYNYNYTLTSGYRHCIGIKNSFAQDQYMTVANMSGRNMRILWSVEKI